MTQLTRRNVLLLAVLMAAATTFVAYLFLTRQQVQALSRDDRIATQTMVVMAKQEVQPLQMLHSDWFTVKQVKADGVPRDAIATPADLNGKVALVNMEPGQIVTARQIAVRSSDLGLAYAVKPPYRAVTVQVDPIIGVAGFPKPGNHVDVLATFSTDYGMVTRTVLQDIEILALNSDSRPKEVDPDSNKTTEGSRQLTTATLAVLPGEAEKLILAVNRGKLQLALRSAEDSSYRSHTITKETLVTGMPVPPKNGVQPVAPAAKPAQVTLPPAAERLLNEEARLLHERATSTMPPPPVLPAVSAPPSEVLPAPKPETPLHVITVIHGTQEEKIQMKSDHKLPHAAAAAAGTGATPVVEGP